MDQATARGLVLPPVILGVRLAQGRHVGRRTAVLRHRQAIEVAAIPRCPVADEWRLPLRHEAPVAFDRHQSFEQGVHQPEAITAPGQVVPHQRAAVVAAAGQEGDVVLSTRLDVGRDLPVGRQAPDPIPRAHGDAAGGAAQAHGLIEMPKAQMQLAPVAAHAHHPPGLVGGEQHRQLQLLQQGGQALGVLITHVDGLELMAWRWLGWGRHGSGLQSGPAQRCSLAAEAQQRPPVLQEGLEAAGVR